MRHPFVFILAVSIAASAASSCQTRAAGAIAVVAPAPVTQAAEPVFREILSQVDGPPGAPGQRLSLVRYTIAPGAQLAAHVHPGVQVASIVSGTLTYRVISGRATVQRSVDPSGVPQSSEVLVGPTESRLEAGDVVVEDGEMIHYGLNRTAQPVVILATLITDPAQALAVPVSTTVP